MEVDDNQFAPGSSQLVVEVVHVLHCVNHRGLVISEIKINRKDSIVNRGELCRYPLVFWILRVRFTYLVIQRFR